MKGKEMLDYDAKNSILSDRYGQPYDEGGGYI